MADSDGGTPNPVVDDMTITYSYRDRTGKDLPTEERAYGPARSKLLARFKPDRGDFSTGYYVQRNCRRWMLFSLSLLNANFTAADNLVFYSLAKYLQGKLGV